MILIKVYSRLQGDDWQKMKSELTVKNYIVSDGNHIKGIYKGSDGKIYSHWLNDDEIKEFINNIKEEIYGR